METINYQRVAYTRAALEERLERQKQLRLALVNKQVTPSSVIGKGHVNPRQDALEYLAANIARYETLLTVMGENR